MSIKLLSKIKQQEKAAKLRGFYFFARPSMTCLWQQDISIIGDTWIGDTALALTARVLEAG